jgi:hypothetical protein
MGYSPKHAKPVSLKSAYRPFGTGGTGTSGRHRAGAVVPAPRLPADAIGGVDEADRTDETDAKGPMKFIPVQRTPLMES